jgi:hypothetical protein
MTSEPVDTSKTPTGRMATWVTVSGAVLTPIFVSAVVFGWITGRTSLVILLCAISCVLLGAGSLAAVKFLRANNTQS